VLALYRRLGCRYGFLCLADEFVQAEDAWAKISKRRVEDGQVLPDVVGPALRMARSESAHPRPWSAARTSRSNRMAGGRFGFVFIVSADEDTGGRALPTQRNPDTDV
jgi:hypothetical protein